MQLFMHCTGSKMYRTSREQVNHVSTHTSTCIAQHRGPFPTLVLSCPLFTIILSLSFSPFSSPIVPLYWKCVLLYHYRLRKDSAYYYEFHMKAFDGEGDVELKVCASGIVSCFKHCLHGSYLFSHPSTHPSGELLMIQAMSVFPHRIFIC